MIGDATADKGSMAADLPNDPTRGGTAAYIPLRFLVDFLEFLRANDDRIEVITYDDLDWGEDWNYQSMYPSERAAWFKSLRDGTRDPSKIYILLQHDVDTREERTMELLRHEERLRIRSNVMIFHRRVNRRHLASTGTMEYTPYSPDLDYLKRLSTEGFVIGYHQNAFEQATFDLEVAGRIFEEDVRSLREHLPVQYCSAHGGTRGPNGGNNHDVPIPCALRKQIRWVHNRYSPWFAATYSDGGINSAHRDPRKRDLRDFVRTWKRGNRYRVLTHPQYYHDPCGRSPRLSGTDWYEEVLSHYDAPAPTSCWNDVELGEEIAARPSAWRLQLSALRARLRSIRRGA